LISNARKWTGSAIALAAILFAHHPASAGPEDDRRAFQAYYQERFPDVQYAEFANGIYAIDEDARNQWLSIEDFPPYEFAVDRGAELWQQALPNGSTMADCWETDVGGIRPQYPQYDAELGEVVTLELAVNLCRKANGAAELPFGKTDIIDRGLPGIRGQGEAGCHQGSRGPAWCTVGLRGRQALLLLEARATEFRLRRLSREIGRSIRACGSPRAEFRASDSFPRLSIQTRRHDFPAPAIFRLCARRAGEALRTAKRRVPKPGVLSHLHE
jgi:hypothetical protein